jgi:hypothetical protein
METGGRKREEGKFTFVVMLVPRNKVSAFAGYVLAMKENNRTSKKLRVAVISFLIAHFNKRLHSPTTSNKLTRCRATSSYLMFQGNGRNRSGERRGGEEVKGKGRHILG